MCTIFNPGGCVIAIIPHSDRLYRVTANKSDSRIGYAATASGKMIISKAHRKFGHISHKAISHVIEKGYITGINLDKDSKPEFCDACAKAKSN